jgi:hypothetical protein
MYIDIYKASLTLLQSRSITRDFTDSRRAMEVRKLYLVRLCMRVCVCVCVCVCACVCLYFCVSSLTSVADSLVVFSKRFSPQPHPRKAPCFLCPSLAQQQCCLDAPRTQHEMVWREYAQFEQTLDRDAAKRILDDKGKEYRRLLAVSRGVCMYVCVCVSFCFCVCVYLRVYGCLNVCAPSFYRPP